MAQYRELYAVDYTIAPNVMIYPPLDPGRNRVAKDIFVGYVTAALGVIAAETQYGITRRFSSDSFDVRSDKLYIFTPGFYKIDFQLTVTGGYDIEIEEAGLGLGQLRATVGTAGTATDEHAISLTAILNDTTISVATPAIIEFNANVQAENLFGQVNSLIYVERIGELVSI